MLERPVIRQGNRIETFQPESLTSASKHKRPFVAVWRLRGFAREGYQERNNTTYARDSRLSRRDCSWPL